MQQELDADGVNVQIGGINGIGHDRMNEDFTEGKDIPWLQDVKTQRIWREWEVEYLDVIVLDESGVAVEVYNLGEFTLRDTDNYSELSRILRGL